LERDIEGFPAGRGIVGAVPGVPNNHRFFPVGRQGENDRQAGWGSRPGAVQLKGGGSDAKITDSSARLVRHPGDSSDFKKDG
jgi:hypothetical protein